MINLAYTSLNTYIRERVRDLGQVSQATSFCLGMAIGRRLPVKDGDPVAALQVYNVAYTYQVDAIASEFNENIPVDITAVNKIAKSIWSMRQISANPASYAVPPRGEGTFFEKIMNVPFFMEPAIMAYYNNHSEALLTIINRMDGIVEQIINDGK